MTSFIASKPTATRGSYVVEQPARTDAIGDILRASFAPKDNAGDEMKHLLAQIDRSGRLS